MPRMAWMRAVPDSFVRALVRDGSPHLDVARARKQHAAYAAELAAAGYEVTTLPADERYPDSPFIEDAVVLIGDTALVTRPGAPSRRGETDAIAGVFGADFAVARIVAPGTLDGGDVLQMGDRIFVGRSTRTNQAAIAQLTTVARALGRSVTPVDIAEDVLHLKSAVLALDDTTVLIADGGADEAAFSNFRIVYQDAADPAHTSVLRTADDRLIATASATATIASLGSAGYRVRPIDVSEFQAADGGLTCMSVLG